MAKIPIILEPGRADGKLVTSGAIFDENKKMFQSELNDIQDTLNSDNPNKPLSANQGRVLKGIIDAKVIEVGAVPIDSEPTEGNITHVVNSDSLAKEFNKCNTEIILGGVYDVSSHNNGIVFESLQALLNSSNLNTLIPTSVRHGGMSIRFIQTSDNNYVQFRYMGTSIAKADFGNTANWQGVDTEPQFNSKNLVTSGGVLNSISRVFPKLSYIGKGTGLNYANSNIINGLIPGRTYRIIIKDPHSLDDITGTSPKFTIIAEDDSDNTLVLFNLNANQGSLQNYYDILIPEGYTKLYLNGRAQLDYEFIAYIKDVTSIAVTGKGNEYILSKDAYQSIMLEKYGLYSHELKLNGKLYFNEDLFEIGNIDSYSQPPLYKDSTSRVRTKKGHLIFLKAGDGISVGQGKTVFISWYDTNGDFHNGSWKTGRAEIYQDGYYLIIMRYSTETTIDSIKDFLSDCYIFTNNTNLATLENDVTRLHGITTFPVSGAPEQPDGEIVVEQAYVCSLPIKVVPGKRYRFITPNASVSRVYNHAFYYSSDGINFTFVKGNYNSHGILDIQVPANANYVRLFSLKYSVLGEYGLFELSNYIRQFEYLDIYKHAIEDKPLWSNAVLSSSEYNSGKRIINIYYYCVIGIRKVGFFINSENTYKMYLGFYDNDMNYINRSEVVSNNPIFDLPNNTSYIKISLAKMSEGVEVDTTEDDITNGMITIDYANVVRESADATSGLVRYFGNTKDNVEKYLQEVYENFAGITEVSLGKTTGYSIQYSNGNYTVKEGYTITDPIFIKKGVTITYRTYTSNENWSCFAVFDSGMIYKKDISARNDISMEFHTFTAPYDCYVRISCDTSYLSKLYFRYSNVSDSISNRLKALETVVFNDCMPDYWIEYLNNKQASINAGLTSVGTHGDIFIFFSDYHVVVNECKSPIVMKYVCERYNIKKVVFGGDVLNTHNSKEISLGLLETFMKSFSFTSIYNVLGNHDNNPYGGSSNVLNEDEYYPILFKHLENKVHMNRGCYYYYENEFQKIRYIVLNTHDNGFNLSSDEDMAQLNWFCATLNSVQEGWYVVVITHMYYEVHENQETHLHHVYVSAGNLIYPITDAYNSKSSGSMSNNGVIYSFDFTSANGKIACLLVGHVHSDYSEVRLSDTAQYPIISIEQDSTYYTGSIETDPTRTKGTPSEQAFDIVCIDTKNKVIKTIRIGAGEDRTFSFT